MAFLSESTPDPNPPDDGGAPPEDRKEAQK